MTGTVDTLEGVAMGTLLQHQQTRRTLLSGGLGCLALAGCKTPMVDTCPDDPAQNFGVEWIPDVARPVAWGEEHLTIADGPPRPLSIYYPSPRFIPPRPLLQLCGWRWPVVYFLHGQPPGGLPAGTDYRRAWWRFPVTLARGGHVVVAPAHHAQLATPELAAGQIAAVESDLAWLRNQWSGARWVDPRPQATAIAGHSYGALIAARLAAAMPGLGAYVGLSGVFTELNDVPQLMQSISVPSFFIFRRDGVFEVIDHQAGPNPSLWHSVPGDTYAASFDGEHFDYLDVANSGTAPRGACREMPERAAELATLFVASRLPSFLQIPVALQRPKRPLLPSQEPLAINYMRAITTSTFDPACQIHLKWRVDGTAGSRSVGLP